MEAHLHSLNPAPNSIISSTLFDPITTFSSKPSKTLLSLLLREFTTKSRSKSTRRTPSRSRVSFYPFSFLLPLLKLTIILLSESFSLGQGETTLYLLETGPRSSLRCSVWSHGQGRGEKGFGVQGRWNPFSSMDVEGGIASPEDETK